MDGDPAAELILALETSSARGSIALGAGAQLLGSCELTVQRRHTTELLPAIRELLVEAGRSPVDVKIVAFSQGPGSFTGLRVAATVARAWQAATGCRVVAVPTLEVIASNARDGSSPLAPGTTTLGVVLDARRGQVYGGTFALDAQRDLTAIHAAALHDLRTWLAALPSGAIVLGDGLAVHGDAVQAAGFRTLAAATWIPRAGEVLRIARGLAARGQYCDPQQIVPCYLRPPECEEVYEQRRAEARERRATER